MKITRKSKKVYTKEIIKAIEKFEYQEYVDLGYQRINGGFAHVEAVDYDDDYIYLELSFGIQDGDEDAVNFENYTLDRKTLEID